MLISICREEYRNAQSKCHAIFWSSPSFLVAVNCKAMLTGGPCTELQHGSHPLIHLKSGRIRAHITHAHEASSFLIWLYN